MFRFFGGFDDKWKSCSSLDAIQCTSIFVLSERNWFSGSSSSSSKKKEKRRGSKPAFAKSCHRPAYSLTHSPGQAVSCGWVFCSPPPAPLPLPIAEFLSMFTLEILFLFLLEFNYKDRWIHLPCSLWGDSSTSSCFEPSLTHPPIHTIAQLIRYAKVAFLH